MLFYQIFLDSCLATLTLEPWYAGKIPAKIPAKNTEKIIKKKFIENLKFAILSLSDEIESLRKLKAKIANNVPIINPVVTIKKHSKEIILKTRFFEYLYPSLKNVFLLTPRHPLQ